MCSHFGGWDFIHRIASWSFQSTDEDSSELRKFDHMGFKAFAYLRYFFVFSMSEMLFLSCYLLSDLRSIIVAFTDFPQILLRICQCQSTVADSSKLSKFGHMGLKADAYLHYFFVFSMSEMLYCRVIYRLQMLVLSVACLFYYFVWFTLLRLSSVSAVRVQYMQAAFIKSTLTWGV